MPAEDLAPTDDYRERELKFDVPDDWELPDPTRFAPEPGSVEREVVHLETTYFDTAARDLLRSRLTLRRRTGDIDAGWQLKVPDGDARIEIRQPLGGRGVPAELREATLGVRSRAALKPVARLTTERAVHRLLDAAGAVQAELVVDEVTAAELGERAVIRQWREVEVELVDGDERLLRRVARRLTKSGATPSASASKLARTLGYEPPTAPDPSRLGGLIAGYLDRQLDAIVRGDIDLRRGRDAVHPTRVATRRYRSVLRGFGDVFEGDAAAGLDEELAWFAAALGEVRDRQVLRTHLDRVLARLPAELVLGPVTDLIDRSLAAERQRAEDELAAVLGSRRYLTLLAELRRRRDEPPATIDRPAARAAKYLARAEHTVTKRRAHIAGADDEDVAAHRARKAAKRARYLAELSEPALGPRARRAAKRAKKVQRRLGQRQDGVLAAEFLRRVAATADAAGENGFTLGLLYERESARGHRAR